jgi:hypothetical protein
MRTSAGESAASQMNSHVLGIDALNELLARPENKVSVANVRDLFETRKGKAHFAPTAAGRGVVQKAKACKPFIELVGTHTHPVIQYALDGIVSTAPEADTRGIGAAHGVGSSGAMCNVAVAGHVMMQSKTVVEDPLKAIREIRMPDKFAIPDYYYITPIEILAKLYIVLVCVRETAASTEWSFRYEVVSSSNMAAAYPKKNSFLSGLGDTSSITKLSASTKIILKAYELGKVVDTNFVDPQKQIVVCVCIRPYEETERAKKEVTRAKKKSTIAFLKPLDVFKTFDVFRAAPARKDRVLVTQGKAGRPNKKTVLSIRTTPVGEGLDEDGLDLDENAVE